MATPLYPRSEAFGSQPVAARKTLRAGYVLGAPMQDLGWFATLLMGLATGFAAFFAATFVGIVSILFWNAAGHKADITASYRLIGLPAGLARAADRAGLPGDAVGTENHAQGVTLLAK